MSIYITNSCQCIFINPQHFIIIVLHIILCTTILCQCLPCHVFCLMTCCQVQHLRDTFCKRTKPVAPCLDHKKAWGGVGFWGIGVGGN